MNRGIAARTQTPLKRLSALLTRFRSLHNERRLPNWTPNQRAKIALNVSNLLSGGTRCVTDHDVPGVVRSLVVPPCCDHDHGKNSSGGDHDDENVDPAEMAVWLSTEIFEQSRQTHPSLLLSNRCFLSSRSAELMCDVVGELLKTTQHQHQQRRSSSSAHLPEENLRVVTETCARALMTASACSLRLGLLDTMAADSSLSSSSPSNRSGRKNASNKRGASTKTSPPSPPKTTIAVVTRERRLMWSDIHNVAYVITHSIAMLPPRSSNLFDDRDALDFVGSVVDSCRMIVTLSTSSEGNDDLMNSFSSSSSRRRQQQHHQKQSRSLKSRERALELLPLNRIPGVLKILTSLFKKCQEPDQTRVGGGGGGRRKSFRNTKRSVQEDVLRVVDLCVEELKVAYRQQGDGENHNTDGDDFDVDTTTTASTATEIPSYLNNRQMFQVVVSLGFMRVASFDVLKMFSTSSQIFRLDPRYLSEDFHQQQQQQQQQQQDRETTRAPPRESSHRSHDLALITFVVKSLAAANCSSGGDDTINETHRILFANADKWLISKLKNALDAVLVTSEHGEVDKPGANNRRKKEVIFGVVFPVLRLLTQCHHHGDGGGDSKNVLPSSSSAKTLLLSLPKSQEYLLRDVISKVVVVPWMMLPSSSSSSPPSWLDVRDTLRYIVCVYESVNKPRSTNDNSNKTSSSSDSPASSTSSSSTSSSSSSSDGALPDRAAAAALGSAVEEASRDIAKCFIASSPGSSHAAPKRLKEADVDNDDDDDAKKELIINNNSSSFLLLRTDSDMRMAVHISPILGKWMKFLFKSQQHRSAEKSTSSSSSSPGVALVRNFLIPVILEPLFQNCDRQIAIVRHLEAQVERDGMQASEQQQQQQQQQKQQRRRDRSTSSAAAISQPQKLLQTTHKCCLWAEAVASMLNEMMMMQASSSRSNVALDVLWEWTLSKKREAAREVAGHATDADDSIVGRSSRAATTPRQSSKHLIECSCSNQKLLTEVIMRPDVQTEEEAEGTIATTTMEQQREKAPPSDADVVAPGGAEGRDGDEAKKKTSANEAQYEVGSSKSDNDDDFLLVF